MARKTPLAPHKSSQTSEHSTTGLTIRREYQPDPKAMLDAAATLLRAVPPDASEEETDSKRLEGAG